jgi:hypothetical protein
MSGTSQGAAGYKFNSFQEIKSHSSILFNERMAILFFQLDQYSIEMNAYQDINKILRVKAILIQIYNNMRMLIRFNPTVRATLNLETQEEGIYVTDVVLGRINLMVEWCETNQYTVKNIYILIQELTNSERMIKDILQYFSYFIRPDFRQKPDIEMATEKYKEMADDRTVDELRELVGKTHNIDFDGLGSSRIEMQEEIAYDPAIDTSDKDDDEVEEEPEEEDADEAKF